MVRVLVVEDSPTQAEELQLILEADGFLVDTARNADAALLQLAATPPDLVLSDIVMPGPSGYDLCRQIKANPATRGIPVVLLTYLADPLDVLRGFEYGADNFLTKPYDGAYLVHRLRSISSNARGRGDAPTGTPLFFRGQGVTITADKAQILDLLLAALEESVRSRERERTAQAAREAIAESGRRKDQFLATLAHELRNPLAPLLTGLHVLRQREIDERTREQSLEAAERQVRHLTRLVDDLLDASRLSVGRLQVRRERIDLARLVRTAAEDRRAALEQANLSLTISTPELPLWINGDDTRLHQVLHNLLDNAARFSEAGGRVTVRLEVKLDGREAATVVHDTGVGIEAGVLARLFDVFVQAEQRLERDKGGLGLGLAVVKGVVELHGGRVQAASAGLGRGAEFTFWLPVEEEPAALRTVGSATEQPTGGGRHEQPARQRVVVVEDNKDAADCLRFLLEALGHEVAVAYTGTEGVRLAGQLRPDVVISDIGLPELDGYGVAAALRRDPATDKALLIAVSGYGQEEDIRRARAAGFDHYLVKPAQPEDLMRLLAVA